MPDRWVRTHKCQDQAGRPRELEIIADDGLISLRTPPGEVARFQPDAVGPLRSLLNEALTEALRQKGGF